MTKQYPIIKLGEHLYGVDKDADTLNQIIIQEKWDVGDGTIIGGEIGRRIINDKNPEMFPDYYNLVSGPDFDKIIGNAKKDHTWRVIATTDKSLNLPLLPPIEEDIDESLEQLLGRSKKWYYEDTWNNIKFGYKLASKKKYSEEDLLKYMEFRMLYWKESIKKAEFKNHEHPFEAQEKAIHERAIQSLKPTPIAIEIEMNSWFKNGHDGKIVVTTPKAKDGFMSIKQYIYEKK